MNTPILVQVTEEDIGRGTRCDGMLCPVAFAVNRALGYHPEANVIDVTVDVIWYACFGRQWQVPAPEVVTRFVRRFDEGMTVEPFNFLFIPPKIVEDHPPCHQATARSSPSGAARTTAGPSPT